MVASVAVRSSLMRRRKFDSGTRLAIFHPARRPCCHRISSGHTNFGMTRVETVCNTCDAHLGFYVFPDGPKPNGLRYCMNAELHSKRYGQLTGATIQIMTTAEVAQQLVESLPAGQGFGSLGPLYSPDISQRRKHGSCNTWIREEIRGLDGVLGEAHWFHMDNNEVAQPTSRRPAGGEALISASIFTYDTTFKSTGVRNLHNNHELGVLCRSRTVRSIREEFTSTRCSLLARIEPAILTL